MLQNKKGGKKMKTYRIICLKRSKIKNSNQYEYLSEWYNDCYIVYWKSNYSGYTNDRMNAGYYTLEELESLNGKFLDWLIEPSWL